MPAAAERTQRLEFGTAVIAPILRYNPGIIAQAFATMGFMYPERIFIGVGTGEAMNEMPVGYDWPPHRERAERLEEAIIIMKRLWTEEFVSFKGKYFTLRKANLYTKPKKPIPIYIASNGPRVAKLAGKYGDGFLTYVMGDPQVEIKHIKNVLFPAIKEGAESAGRDFTLIEKALCIAVSYDEDYDKAVESCRFWAAFLLPWTYKYPVYDTRELEMHANMVGKETLEKSWIIATTPEDAIKTTEEYLKLGFTNIHYISSSPEEKKFLKVFGENVIPYLKEKYG